MIEQLLRKFKVRREGHSPLEGSSRRRARELGGVRGEGIGAQKPRGPLLGDGLV